MSNLYKENKNFINKYKSLLEAALKRKNHLENVKMNVYVTNPVNTTIYVGVNPVFEDNKVYITEASKRLYFCVKIKEMDRYFVSTQFDQSSDTKLALEAFVGKLSRYNTSQSDVDSIRKFLESKNITKIGNREIKSDNAWEWIYELKDTPDVLDGYAGVEDYKKIIKSLKEAPIEIYRHPDVFKSIKEKDLIPVSYMDENDLLTHPTTYASSRKATGFYDKSYTDSIIQNGRLKTISDRAIHCTPFNYWVVYNIKSSIVDERRTLNFNFEV